MEAAQQGPQIIGGTVTIRPDRWWVPALLGLVSIVVGILALAYPDITLLALGLFFGINLLFAGILWVMVGVDEDSGGGGRALRLIVGFLAILGVIGIAAGIIIVANPDIGLETLALLAGIAFIVRGTVELIAGFALRSLRA